MKIVDFIRQELIVPELSGARPSPTCWPSWPRTWPAHHDGVDADALLRVLVEREQLASTAIGEGVAIPHGKLDAVGELVACVGRARAGRRVRLDGRPADPPLLRAGGAGELDRRPPQGAGAHQPRCSRTPSSARGCWRADGRRRDVPRSSPRRTRSTEWRCQPMLSVSVEQLARPTERRPGARRVLAGQAGLGATDHRSRASRSRAWR